MGLYDYYYGGPGDKKMTPFGGALNFAGSALGAVGSLMSASAQSSAYKAEAKTKDLEAKDVAKVTKSQITDLDRAKRMEEGKQRATYANLGLEVQGTAIENLADMAKQMALAKQWTQRNSSMKIYGLQQEAKQLRKAASSATRAGVLGAVGSFL